MAVAVGIASVQLFDMAFSDTVFSLSGSEVTVETVVSLLVFGYIYVTNDNDISSMDDFYTAALVRTVGLTLAIPPGHPHQKNLHTVSSRPRGANSFERVTDVEIINQAIDSIWREKLPQERGISPFSWQIST